MMNNKQRILIYSYILIPIISLIVSLISWLRFGIDLPYWDDWRYYLQGTIGSFDIKYLFTSGNDTLAPVGLFLDSILYKYLDGNTIAYQFVTMISILGILLFLQWKLLSIALNNRLMTASSFSLSILMLQPDSYWGLQNIAYHQALPLIFVLTSIYVVINQKMKIKWLIPLLFMLGLLSGFSYTSGAFSILILGVLFLIFSYFIKKDENIFLKAGGISLSLSGIITSIAQLWVIVIKQKGVHLPVPMALPNESEFWLFMLGKIARSIMLPIGKPLLSFIVTITILIVILFLVIWSFKLIKNYRTSLVSEIKTAHIFIALLCVIFVYLSLVSAGRTNLRSLEMNETLEIFTFGFYRFHFFWITLLWPWMAAIFFIVLKNLNPKLQNKFVIFSPMILIPIFISSGAFNHGVFYKETADIRVKGLECLKEGLENDTEMYCPSIFPTSLKLAFENAKKLHASFIRIIPSPQMITHLVIDDINKSVEYTNQASQILKEDHRINLKFTSTHIKERKRLKKIFVLFGTYARKNVGNAKLTLKTDSGTTFIKEFSLSILEDNQYYGFNVDGEYYSSGEIESLTGGGISTWESHDVDDNKVQYTCIIYQYTTGETRLTPGCIN